MKPIAMMKRTRSRLNSGRGRLGYSKPTLTDGQEIRPRLNNVQQNYEKYISLARDALTSGDRITAEGYYQHAEHYLRLMNEYKAYVQEKAEQEVAVTAVTLDEVNEGETELQNQQEELAAVEEVDVQDPIKSEQLVA